MANVFRVSPYNEAVENDALGPVDNAISRALRESLRLQTILDYRIAIAGCFGAIILASLVYLLARPTLSTATATVLVGSTATPDDLRDVVVAAGNIVELRFKLFASRAKQERLAAELEGAAEFNVSAALSADQQEPESVDVIGREELLFITRKEALDEKLDAASRTLEMYRSGVDLLGRQVEFSTEQQVSIDEEVASTRTLVEKGLTATSNLRELERSASAISSRKIEVEAELMRLRQSVIAAEQTLVEIQNERRTEILTELQEVESEIRAAQAELATSEGLRSSLLYARAADDAAVENQMALLRSDEMALRIVRQHDLANDQFIGANVPGLFGRSSPPEAGGQLAALSQEDLAVRTLKGDLEISRLGRGSEIAVTFRSADPARAGLVANAIAGAYVDSSPRNDQLTDTSFSAMMAGSVIERAVPEPEGPGGRKVLALAVFAGALFSVMAALVFAFARAFVREAMHPLAPPTRD